VISHNVGDGEDTMSSQSAVDYALARGAEHLFVVGMLFLLISFFLMLGVASADGGGTGIAVLSWCENTAFWLGIVSVAGDVAARVFRRPSLERRDRS
jgi:hypothetical protein